MTGCLSPPARKLGPINYDDIVIDLNEYCIVHQQAPTTENRDISAVHPAEYNGMYLWHNGILKPNTIKYLQEICKSDSSWDSMLLLNYLYYHTAPNEIDGSFSCLFWDNTSPHTQQLYMFRNEIAPLFIDDDLNISSTKFANSKSVKPNRLIGIYPEGQYTLDIDIIFNTVDNPYVLKAGN